MTRIDLPDGVEHDFIRILDFFASHQIPDGASRVAEIIQGIAVLEKNPLIGRPVRNDKRELVMGRRSHGYVALYKYFEQADLVIILAIHSQRESGYARR